MNTPSHPTRVTIAEADALTMPPDRLSKQVLNTPGLEARWYRPPDPDPQTPHDRDEVYVVAAGRGEFVRETTRVSFAPGDLLFAARGEAHRFENHTPDTAVWVIFGPGPEATSGHAVEDSADLDAGLDHPAPVRPLGDRSGSMAAP